MRDGFFEICGTPSSKCVKRPIPRKANLFQQGRGVTTFIKVNDVQSLAKLPGSAKIAMRLLANYSWEGSGSTSYFPRLAISSPTLAASKIAAVRRGGEISGMKKPCRRHRLRPMLLL